MFCLPFTSFWAMTKDRDSVFHQSLKRLVDRGAAISCRVDSDAGGVAVAAAFGDFCPATAP